MHNTLRSIRPGLAAVVTSTLIACGGGSTQPTPPPPPPPPPPPAAVASVAVQPGTATLSPQQTQQLTATVRDAQGNTLTGRTVTWSSDAQAVATVSTSGLVTAVRGGTARITATSEGQSGSATMTVVDGVQVGPTGGTFTFEDEAVTLTVPAGALSTPTVVTVTRVPTPISTAPTGWQRVGPVYALGPAGVSFTQPVTVTLKYDAADLPAFTMTGDIGVLEWSGGTGRGLTGVAVNTQARTISGRTSGFGAAPIAGAAPRGLFPTGTAAGDESEVAVMVQDPTVSLAPSESSVNSSHRHANFTVAVEARGEGVPLPENTPALLYRWRSTTQHGGLGIDAPGANEWTETTSVEYVATNPQIGQVSGPIDRVTVEVLLNPESLTNPAAGPQRIVSAEAVVNADLQVTYDITPERKTIKQGAEADLRARARDKEGREINLGGDFRAIWETSGNHGELLETEGLQVTYRAHEEFEFPPPRVDRVVVSILEKRRHNSVIREKKAITNTITGEKHAMLEAVDLETELERGRDTAFVTVEVEYEVELKTSRDTIPLGGTAQLQAVVDPEPESEVRYRFTSAQTHGTLTPASGTLSQAATAQYQARTNATGGPEKIKVEVLDQDLKVLAEAEVEIEVDAWRAGSFTVLSQDVNCVVPFIIIPKVQGATGYEVLADRFNHPDIGREFTSSFSGASGGNGVFSVQDGGGSWRIRMEGGGCAISDTARDVMRQAMFNRFAGIRVRFRVTGGS